MMKYSILLLCMTVLLSCSSNGDKPATTSDSSAQKGAVAGDTVIKPTLSDADVAELEANPDKLKDKVSYGMGYNMGKSFREQKIEVNYENIIQGLKDGLENNTDMKYSKEEIEKALFTFEKVMLKKQEELAKEREKEWMSQSEKNKVEGQEFLKNNKNKEGIITTTSGLQYQILKSGTGDFPKTDDIVKVHVVAKYMDGKEFDNTYKRTAQDLPMSKLIPAWKEALTKMKVGSKWRLFVPPDLAYGDKGVPPTVPGNAVLIFEMELVKIVGKEK